MATNPDRCAITLSLSKQLSRIILTCLKSILAQSRKETTALPQPQPREIQELLGLDEGGIRRAGVGKERLLVVGRGSTYAADVARGEPWVGTGP